jgi:hypothetical protein
VDNISTKFNKLKFKFIIIIINYKHVQNTWEINCNMQLYKQAKWDLIFTQSIKIHN